MNSKIISIFSLIIALLGAGYLYVAQQKQVRYAFVNTETLLNSFVESSRALDEIHKEEENWKNQRTTIEDSLKAFEERFAAVYDTASVKTKTEFKQEQIRRIEEMNRFNHAFGTKIQNMQVEKLGAIYQKINIAMNDYATENGLDVVFASSNGSIVYGNGTSADITNEFVAFLNDRFK